MKNKDKLELILEVLGGIKKLQNEIVDGDRHIAALQANSTEKRILSILAISPKSDVLHRVMKIIYDLHIFSAFSELERELDEIARDKIFSRGEK